METGGERAGNVRKDDVGEEMLNQQGEKEERCRNVLDAGAFRGQQ